MEKNGSSLKVFCRILEMPRQRVKSRRKYWFFQMLGNFQGGSQSSGKWYVRFDGFNSPGCSLEFWWFPLDLAARCCGIFQNEKSSFSNSFLLQNPHLEILAQKSVLLPNVSTLTFQKIRLLKGWNFSILFFLKQDWNCQFIISIARVDFFQWKIEARKFKYSIYLKIPYKYFFEFWPI